MEKNATPQISRDLLVYGDAATVADRDRFGANLSRHLADKFEIEVHVVLTDGRAGSDDPEVNAEVRRICEGDDWTSFL